MSKFSFFSRVHSKFLGQVLANISMEQMEYGSYSLGERKGGVFRKVNVKNEDLQLHDFTANQELHFYFLMKKISILHSPPPTMPGKKRIFKKCSRARKNI